MSFPLVQSSKYSPVGDDAEVDSFVRKKQITLPERSGTATAADKVVSDPYVRLDPPPAGAGTKLSGVPVPKLEALHEAAKSIRDSYPALVDFLLREDVGMMSSDDFTIELSQLMSVYKKKQTDLSLSQIKQRTEENKLQMDENLKKVNEVNETAKSAKKAGLFAKVFGWVAAIVSVVVGLALVCTGVGAAMGAAMMVGGALGIANMAVQQAAEDGRISKETMKWLGPTLMAATIVVGIVSAGVAFAPSLATTLSSVAQTAVQAIMVTTGALSSGSSLASTICNIQLLKSETAMAEMKLTLEQGQKILEKLLARLKEMMEQNSEVLDKVLAMVKANNKICQDVSQRQPVQM